MTVSQALYDLLLADETTLAFVGRTMMDDGSSVPNIWMDEPPADSGFPLIVSMGPTSETPIYRLEQNLRDIRRDVSIYQSQSSDPAALEDFVDHLLRYLAHPTVSVAGYRVVAWYPEGGPSIAPTDQTVRGRVINLRVLLEPES